MGRWRAAPEGLARTPNRCTMSAMQRIGVDAVSVDRIALAVRRSGPGFLAKVYTPAELTYCNGNDERLAGRWAAKEAVIKATVAGVEETRTVTITGAALPDYKTGQTPDPAVGVTIPNMQGQAFDGTPVHSRLAVATAHLEIPDVGTMLPAPDAVLIPARPKDAHKGTFGTAVVLAGSLGLTGAAYLSSTAAARTGAGLVRLLVPTTIYPILAVKCTEVMATPVPEVAPGAVGHAAYDSILRQLESAEVGIIGPGLGRDSSTWRLVVDLALHAHSPTPTASTRSPTRPARKASSAPGAC